MQKIPLLILVTLVVITSCKKDKLEGAYDRIEGKYQWIYSDYTYRDCILCALKYHVDSAKEANYTAQIEFDNTSCVTFYIDNAELTKKKFRISAFNSKHGSQWQAQSRTRVFTF